MRKKTGHNDDVRVYQLLSVSVRICLTSTHKRCIKKETASSLICTYFQVCDQQYNELDLIGFWLQPLSRLSLFMTTGMLFKTRACAMHDPLIR